MPGKLYRHAAQLVVDHVYVVSVTFNPLPEGFATDGAGDLFPTREEAEAAAKAYLANTAASNAFMADARSGSTTDLRRLLTEWEEQRELVDEMAGMEDEGGDDSEQASDAPPDRDTTGSRQPS